ncbi:hypothetical protein CCR85_01385 [Rhodothalassium salexigens]|uniref:Ribbon-helix-helix CopG family protein n=1 Tax=Rhodothalassium salexigens DSM 2132 TaxID=1188247 RepID=A0A4R2PPH8_RHOSA|nr:hypothetical protein [Rhodothalassium salexigens]MBB4210792.1 hypothetical protein [Rhodothalassium salexigens DSM 2132]MBK1639125.1 hypothetical protein [Rhodothalassium salexigens DSM 2132]MBK5910145.1 hypothetical protein [Rhodothalassium salexigens]MBK5920767.1 hypothetical protein [Rhodothalassium salexigens]TCP37653.1 hypothetical protein EV659_10258 [Rhodothalassium salexigens DSM 2132]
MPLEKFATQLDSDTLQDLRALAKTEGRQIQSLVQEALSEYLTAKREGRARPHVLRAYEGSLERYGSVYEKLAR